MNPPEAAAMLPTSSNFFDTSSVVISSVAVWMIFRSSVGGSAPGAAPLPPALPPDVLAAAGASAMEPLCRAASALSYDLSCASGAGAFAIDLHGRPAVRIAALCAGRRLVLRELRRSAARRGKQHRRHGNGRCPCQPPMRLEYPVMTSSSNHSTQGGDVSRTPGGAGLFPWLTTKFTKPAARREHEGDGQGTNHRPARPPDRRPHIFPNVYIRVPRR